MEEWAATVMAIGDVEACHEDQFDDLAIAQLSVALCAYCGQRI